jgi:pyruvate dehydrogenase E2 component (dihydrolipoamide acetyltransferase)
MAHAILMPKPGQMTETCVLTLWRKEEGDPVRKGDVLFEIETDKSSMEVESFDDGVLLRRLVREGEEVPVNVVCAWVGQPGEAIPEPAAVPPAAPVAVIAPVAAIAPVPAWTVEAPAVQVSTSAAPRDDARPRVSPRASRLARGTALDPHEIRGTGPGGRVVERDVRAALETAALADAPARAADGEEEPRPLSRMRRVIADRLTLSATTIPHFTVTVAVDVTRLLALRHELKAGGRTLSVTDFVLAGTAQSLTEFPDVNSRTDGQVLWRRRRVHLGLAVSLPGGLVVPVIRDADRLSIEELHDRLASLVAAARDGTLAVDDMTGGTFTVSNMGMLGVDEFSAIINPGESGILAVGAAQPAPVVVGDGIAVRSVMKLTLSADHRLVDGEQGARFLVAIRRRLEDLRWIRSALAET